MCPLNMLLCGVVSLLLLVLCEGAPAPPELKAGGGGGRECEPTVLPGQRKPAAATQGLVLQQTPPLTSGDRGVTVASVGESLLEEKSLPPSVETGLGAPEEESGNEQYPKAAKSDGGYIGVDPF